MNEHLLDMHHTIFSYSPIAEEGWRLNIPNFSIGPRELCLISGDNMSGKTTFLNLIGGLLPLQNCTGAIRFNDQLIRSAEDMQSHSILLSSDDKMFPELSVWENIYISLTGSSLRPRNVITEKLRDFFQKSDIFSLDILDTPLGNLSSGGRALVKLGRAYISSHPLIIIDELSSFLDSKRAIYFLDKVIALRESGRSILIVSHNERDRKHLANREKIEAYHISRSHTLSTIEKIEP